MLQNAVKYNNYKGSLIIVLRFEYIDVQEEEWIFETEIIDTGIGISKERQKMLFKPFLELKLRQNMTNVKDNNIGLGLSCAKDIAKQLGGDVVINNSN